VLRIGHVQAASRSSDDPLRPEILLGGATTMLQTAREALAALGTLFDADLIEDQAVKSPPRASRTVRRHRSLPRHPQS